MTNQPFVLTALKNNILTITLNRPSARNALSTEVMRNLLLALDNAAKDDATKVIVLAAQGTVFCAGHDLKEMTAHRADPDNGLSFYRELFAQCSHLMQTIVHHPVPVIAKVQGIATAAGCQLVASCDLAVAAENVHFTTPGVNIGLFCSTPMVALSRNLGRKAAMEMLLTGEIVDADRAEAVGLVNRVVKPENLDAVTMALAELIASKPTATLRLGKQAYYRQLELSLSSAYDYVGEVMVQNMMHGEAVEGIGAFLEKRLPKWPEKQ
jgi:enoyl-CoA hydratase/carnithine racemase